MTVIELNPFRENITRLPPGACEAEVQAEKEAIVSAAVSGGKTAGSAASELTALFIRVSGEKTGHIYTQKLGSDPVELLRMAYENSLDLGTAGPESMHGPDSTGIGLNETELSSTPPDDLKALALDLERAVRNAAGALSYSHVAVTETIRTMGLVNSKGCNLSSSRRNIEAAVTLVREDADEHYVYEESLSSAVIGGIKPDYFIGQLQKWRMTQLPGIVCAPGTYRAVLDSSVVCNILNTAWQMFSAPFYITENTPLSGKLGERVFSEAVSITDSPVMPGCGYQFPFDCEGSCGTEAVLADRGSICGLLQILESSREMGLPPTGNAGRKALMSGMVHTSVGAMPKNFRLLPGKSTRDALIGSLTEGLYVNESYDVFHSINVASGDYAIPCKAVVVKNGIMTGVAEGLTIYGNVIDLLAAVEDVANDVKVLPMVMLKSYAVSSPSLLISHLKVSGGSA
jgi:PmbA protein